MAAHGDDPLGAPHPADSPRRQAHGAVAGAEDIRDRLHVRDLVWRGHLLGRHESAVGQRHVGIGGLGASHELALFAGRWVTVAPILAGERDDVRGQRVLVGTLARHLALCRAVLAENPAGKAFRDRELLLHMVDTLTTAGGAQQFPDAASRRINFSSVRSETAFRSRSIAIVARTNGASMARPSRVPSAVLPGRPAVRRTPCAPVIGELRHTDRPHRLGH